MFLTKCESFSESVNSPLNHLPATSKLRIFSSQVEFGRASILRGSKPIQAKARLEAVSPDIKRSLDLLEREGIDFVRFETDKRSFDLL